MIELLDQLEYKIEEAKKFILDNDRMMFEPFFKCAEEFCEENDVLIGGNVGIDLLVNNPLTIDSFKWDLYTMDVYEKSKKLIDKLYQINSPHIPVETLMLQTNIINKEYSIYVDTRLLFVLRSMNIHRGINLIKLMVPPTAESYFTKHKLKCVSEELQLIGLYQILYTPNATSQWEHVALNETKLYEKVKENLEKKSLTIVKESQQVEGSSEDDNPKIKSNFIINYNDIIIDNFADDIIIVNDIAFNELNITKYDNPRLEFITNIDIYELSKRIERTAIDSGMDDAEITYRYFKTNIPNDLRLTKCTLYANRKNKQIPIADVYNSTAFELIPFVKIEEKKIGNLFVLLRFLFIRIWMLKFVLNIKISNQNNADALSNTIVELIEIADNLRELYKEKLNNPTELFQLHNYDGIYLDPTIKKKTRKFISDYYPAMPSKNTNVIRSSKIDFNVDVESKLQILKKIFNELPKKKQSSDKDNYYIFGYLWTIFRNRKFKTNKENADWSINKNIDKSTKQNKYILPYLEKTFSNDSSLTILDFGCGSGADLLAISKMTEKYYTVSNKYCADIKDNRKYKTTEFINVECNVSLELKDKSIDIVILFHVLHHCDDLNFRIRDIIRVLKDGGLLIIKDHNAKNEIDEQNITFEHFVNSIADGSFDKDYPNFTIEDFEKIINNYYEMNPLYLFDFETLESMLLRMERLMYVQSSKPTKIFTAIYQKK